MLQSIFPSPSKITKQTNNTIKKIKKPSNDDIHKTINSPPINNNDIWTKHQILVYGYVEQNYHHHDEAIAIPLDIIDLILKFYDNIFYWSFTNNLNNTNNVTFNKFLSTSNGETIWSESIKVKEDIIFQYSICPNGWFPFQKGYVQFYLEMIEIPSNIKEIIVNFKVYCKELKLEWNDRNKFNRIPQAIGWPRYHMPLIQCNKYNSLHFCCFLEIDHIEYKNNHKSGLLMEAFDDDEEQEGEEELDMDMDMVDGNTNTNTNTAMATVTSTIMTDEIDDEESMTNDESDDNDYSLEQLLNDDHVNQMFDNQYL